MTIRTRVLGGTDSDNALYVEIDTGQSIERVLFDCGEGVPAQIPFMDVLQLRHVCFSHMHMDHVAGFTTLFRRLYKNDRQGVTFWGPPGTAARLQSQMRGFLWNLVAASPTTFSLCDVGDRKVTRFRTQLADGFEALAEEGQAEHGGLLIRGAGYTVHTLPLDHRSPSLAFVVREDPIRNVSMPRAAALGLAAGPWMQRLKDGSSGDAVVQVGERSFSLAELRRELLIERAGDAVAYCTDFLLDDAAIERLVPFLAGVRLLVCESQYRDVDRDLATANWHMTNVQVATLARDAGVQELTLIHVSDRYDEEGRAAMLADAREVFPGARFPVEWE